MIGVENLVAGHQGLEQLLAVTSADNVDTSVAEQLLHSLSQIANGRGIRLLNEQIARGGVLEGEHDQAHSLVQLHQEAGHVGVSDSDEVASLDLVDEQGNNGATTAHDVAITSAADGGAATLSGHTSVGGVDDVLHHCLGDAHGVDGISRLIGGQADHPLDTRINGNVQHVVRAHDIGLNRLHREELAGRNLLQSCGVEDVVNTMHGVTDRLGIANVTDVELDLLGGLRVLCLKLVAHIVLHLLIPKEDADFLQIGIQEVLQNGRTERAGTASNHKGCIIKCRHCYFLSIIHFFSQLAFYAQQFHLR